MGPSHLCTTSTANPSLHRIIEMFKDEGAGCTLVAEDWPTFLYDEQAGWNERNIRNGLFRGHVLVRVGPTKCILPGADLSINDKCTGCTSGLP